MIVISSIQPKAFEGMDPDGCRWMSGSDEDGVYCWIAVKLKADEGQVHLQVVRWSHNILKKLTRDWRHVLKYCYLRGCRQMTAVSTPDDPKWERFIKHFGFPGPINILCSTMEVDNG